MTDETAPRRVRRTKQPRVPGDFPELLRGIREERGLTQEAMGILLGFPPKDAQSNYSKWERGENRPKDLYAIRQMEDILEVPPGKLVDAAFGPGAYALPEDLRTNLRSLNTSQLRLITEIAIGLNAIDRDIAEVGVSTAVRDFITTVNQKRPSKT